MYKILVLFFFTLVFSFFIGCSGGGSGGSSETKTTTSADDISLDSTLIVNVSSLVDGTRVEGTLIPEKEAQIRTLNLQSGDIKVKVTSKNGEETILPSEVSEVNQSITFTAPLNTVDGNLSIIDGTTILKSIPYKIYKDHKPYISTISPEIANPGDTVTINGQNLSSSMFVISQANELNISVTPVSNQVSFTLPLDAKSGYVHLATDAQKSNELFMVVKKDMDVIVSIPQELNLNASDIAFTLSGKEYTLDGNFEATIPVENSIQHIHSTVELDDGSFSLLYSGVVLPDMTGPITIDANSTAISWMFIGMQSSVSVQEDDLRTLYDSVASNTKVQEFAKYIVTLQKNDFSKWSDRNDPTLKQKYQDALQDLMQNYKKSASPKLADTVDTSNELVTIKQDPENGNIYVNDLAYGYITNDKLNNGSVTVVNDTKLFLSVEARSKEDDSIVNEYEHVVNIMDMDQKTLLGPKGWGLLGISSAQEIQLGGEDSNLEIIVGAYNGTTDKTNVSDLLKARVFIDGIASPTLNMILTTLLDRTIPKTHSHKNVIDAMSDIYGSGFLIQLTTQVSNQNTNWTKTVDSLVVKPLVSGFDSCFQVPVGGNCEKVMIGLAKLLGVNAENAVNKLMLLTLEAAQKRIIKRSAVLLPVLGWIAEASFLVYDNISYVSDSATIAESIYDMKQNPKEINVDVDFKLKISDVEPMCLAVTPAFSPVLLHVKGEGFDVEGADAPEIFIKNSELHDSSLATIDMRTATEMSMQFDAQNLVQDGSTLGSLFIGYDGISAMYDKELKIVDERDTTVHFDSITPEKATYGATITLKGCGWLPLNDIKVYFKSANGEVQGEVISKDVETIEVKVPDNAVSGFVYVTAGIKKTKNIYFEVEPFGLSGADLESLNEDYAVVLEGKGLNDTKKVYFVDSSGSKKEGVIHTISISDTSVIVDIPTDLSIGDVSIYAVRNDGKESNALNIPLLPKEVTATPDSQSFIDTITVTLSQEDGDDIYYTIDDGEEQKYNGSFTLNTQDSTYNYFMVKTYARVTIDGVSYDSKINTYNYIPCESGETLVNGECSSSCNKVCANPTISNDISFASYSGEFTITLTFEENFKWCTEVIDDNSSLNNEITMLYFYKTDGSGTYSQPSSYSYTFGQAFGLSKISLSPLPDYNSYTYQYYTPEDTFGMSVGNYDSLSSSNQYDFLWVTSDEDLSDKETRTIINTEWVESNGCYEGDY